MPTHSEKIIKSLKKNIRDQTTPDTNIRKLREMKEQDTLIDFTLPREVKFEVTNKLTLLMCLVLLNEYEKIKTLLTGEHSASVLVQNDAGESALYLAVHMAGYNPHFNLEIIDELVKYEPEKQTLFEAKGETPLLLAIRLKQLYCVQKLASINNKEQFFQIDKRSTLSPLMASVLNDCELTIRELLKYYKKEQLLNQTTNGLIALHFALRHAKFTATRILLEEYPEQQLLTKKTESTLDCILRSTNYELIEWLIISFPFILSIKSIANSNALLVACSLKSNTKIIELILQYGSKSQLIEPNDLNEIPLDIFVQNDDAENAKILLKYNPELQIRSDTIDFICLTGSTRVFHVIANIIREQKLDLPTLFLSPNCIGSTPLHSVITKSKEMKDYPFSILTDLLSFIPEQQISALCQKESIQLNSIAICIANKNLAVLKEIAKFALPEHYEFIDKYNQIALHYAFEFKFLAGILFLLKYGPISQLKFQVLGRYPIHLAVIRNMPIVLQQITTIDATQLEMKDENGNTPLMTACLYGVKESALFLIKCNANKHVIDKYNNTPLHHASTKGNIDITFAFINYDYTEDYLLQKNSYGDNFLHCAVINGNIALILHLFDSVLKKNASLKNKLITSTNDCGLTILHLAARYGFIALVKLFIEAGAKIDVVSQGGYLPLHYASAYGHSSVVLEIVKYDISPDLLLNNGYTPLYVACEGGYGVIAKILIEKYPLFLEVRQSNQCTPLLQAILHAHLSLISTLVNLKANIHVTICLENNWQINAIIIAIILADIKLLALLIKLGANPNQRLTLHNTTYTAYDYANSLKDDTKKSILEELKKSTHNAISTENKVENSHHALINTIQLTGRGYLTFLGFDEEEINSLEEQRKANKNALKKLNNRLFTVPDEKNVEISWFNKLFTNKHPELTPLENCSTYAFCYLDKAILIKQGCNPEDLSDIRYKFGNKNLKKLDDDKGRFSESILLPSGSEEKIVYTHELKINKMDRILLFEMQSDCHSACLYVGAKYLSKGLHNNNQRIALFTSISQSKPKKICWPGTTPGIENNESDNQTSEIRLISNSI